MIKNLLLTVTAALLATTAGSAAAWGEDGHRIVGELAAERLTPQARAEVARLLEGEPEPTLPGVANWADEVKDQTSSRWHYVNFPRGDCHYTPPLCPDGQCVVAAIQRFSAVLADRSRPRAERAEALKYLVHLVGDVHQPLHAGWADDKGGNQYQVRLGNRGSNLHALWDSGMLNLLDGRHWEGYADKLSRHAGGIVPASASNPQSWAEESCLVVSRPGFYPTFRLAGFAYIVVWQPAMDQRLTLAGQRLAGLLNADLR